MKKGPLLNKNTNNFTTRDSLGIEGVAASISAELCPIVNTVTPRAFYWPFLVWNYYDFYKNSGITEHTYNTFDKQFLKRQDYFFVLSQLLINSTDQYNLVGIQNTQIDVNNNPDGPYKYNKNYFVTSFGGMQYYNAGCITMDYIREIDVENNKRFSFPRITQIGKEMALYFESVIKNTEYYKNYRMIDVPVPRSVLEEYGNVINLGMNGFDRCKESLRKRLFENERYFMLRDSAEYLKFIFDKYNMYDSKLNEYRGILFDSFSPRGRKEMLPDELRSISSGWEIVIGRQYFTCGLECIWKYMLYLLSGESKTKNDWIEDSINSSTWNCDINSSIGDLLENCDLDFETRELMIYDAAHLRNEQYMVENGLKLILSMYNRFVDRDDFDKESAYLSWGNDTASISFEELILTVQNYINRPIKDFLVFVMNRWLIEQHYNTAFEKLLQNRDGFYYEIVDGYYYHKHDFYIAFQGVRLYQLAQVMRDLDILKR